MKNSPNPQFINRLIRKKRVSRERLKARGPRRRPLIKRENTATRGRRPQGADLLETAQSLLQTPHPDDGAACLMNVLGHYLSCDGGSLYLAREDGLQLTESLDPGHAPPFIPFPLPRRSVFELALSSGKPVLIQDDKELAGYAVSGWRGYPGDSALAFPLTDNGGRSMGVLSLHGRCQPPFSHEDLSLGWRLTNYGAAVLKKARFTEALVASEEKFRTISTSAQDAIIMMAPDGGVSFWNQAAEAIFGYKAAEVMGRDLHQLIAPPHHQAQFQNAFPKFKQNGFGTAINRPLQLEALSKNRRPVPVEISLSSVLLHGQRHAMGIVRDISERKMAEAILRASEQKFRSYIDNAPDGIFVLNRQADFIEVNAATCQMIGYSEVDLLDKNLLTLTPLESRREAIALFNRLFREGGAAGGLTVKTRQEVRRYWDFNGIKLADNRFIGFAKDITEEHKLEVRLRQAQKMESIGTLAGGIAHDFNNILSSILGYTELTLAMLPETDEQVRHYVSAVHKAGKRARDLVAQILTFSRQSEQIYAPVQVHLIVKEALKLLRSSLPSTIEIRQHISDAGRALADPTQIHQVMMNLCTNAFHAMQEKGGIMEVTLTSFQVDPVEAAESPDLMPGEYLRLTVADTGCGMNPGIVDRIFDPYYTTKEKDKGTGLGLAVVHGIVKSHNGAVTVESEEGKGSVFNVYFPATGADEHQQAHTAERLPMGGEHILLVDDEKEIVDIDQQMLERLGYRVTPQVNSLEALQLFQERPDAFDMIITDLTMPNLTGDRLAREILKVRPNIPVVLCTGFSEMMDADKARQMGIQKFLMKPVSMMEFAWAIREVLDTPGS